MVVVVVVVRLGELFSSVSTSIESITIKRHCQY